MPVNYSTPIGRVRLLTGDVDDTNYTVPDDALYGYLELHGSDGSDATPAQVKRAAADALDAVATSEALVSKVMRTQDASTDGSKVAASLRAHADRLRVDADRDDAAAATAAGDGGDWFGVAEFSPSGWS